MMYTKKTKGLNNSKMRSKCLELNHREVHSYEERKLDSWDFRALQVDSNLILGAKLVNQCKTIWALRYLAEEQEREIREVVGRTTMEKM